MFKILGETKDLKSGAVVIYCQCSPQQYLDIVGQEFGDFAIQRKRENHRAYKRLKLDIIEGALLPSITLSIKHHLVGDVLSIKDNAEHLYQKLQQGNAVDILDGLQRTYILSDIKTEGITFKDGQLLLLELWLEGDLSKLIYRMIVLNSGQKAMSMRHQIELLFMSLKETIAIEVPGVEIFTERDQKRRTQYNKYNLNNIASAYQAFITGSHETDKENLVAQRLVDENAFDSSEEELRSKFNDFIFYMKNFVEIDKRCWSWYSNISNEKYIELLDDETLDPNDARVIEAINTFRESITWLGSENTMLAFFGAISQYIALDRKERIDAAIAQLIKNSSDLDKLDPLGMINYNKIKSGLNPRKYNIGFATRRLISNSFKEFFRESGETSLENCWSQAAE